MITQEEFSSYCDTFYKNYVTAKRDISAVETIVKSQIIPISAAYSVRPGAECRAGCAHCCQLRVVAFPHELTAIYLYIKRTYSSEKVQEIRKRIDEQFKIVSGFTEDEHFKTNVQCPLLENNLCRVYPVRPLSCAGYHSMSEAICRESNENPEITGTESGGIPMVVDIKWAQEIQVLAASQVIQSMGDDPEQYELIKGLYAIFHDPTVNQRWINGRKFQK